MNSKELLMYLIIFLVAFAFGYFIMDTFLSGSLHEGFETYKEMRAGTEDINRKVNLVNNFTKDGNCSEEDFTYCAKFGKVAIDNWNVPGCQCSYLESGV